MRHFSTNSAKAYDGFTVSACRNLLVLYIAFPMLTMRIPTGDTALELSCLTGHSNGQLEKSKTAVSDYFTAILSSSTWEGPRRGPDAYARVAEPIDHIPDRALVAFVENVNNLDAEVRLPDCLSEVALHRMADPFTLRMDVA